MSNDINVLKPARPIPIGPGSIYIHRGRQSFPNRELRQSASADNPLLLTQSASADNLLLPKLILPGTTAFGTLVTSGVGITTIPPLMVFALEDLWKARVRVVASLKTPRH